MPPSLTAVLPMASAEKMITTQTMINANERATRSRKLNDSEYKNSEKAVMAIPAIKISLVVFNTVSIRINPRCVLP